MIDDFLTELERSLSGPSKDREQSIAALRAHLQQSDDDGELAATLEDLGSPQEVAARMLAGGHGRCRHLDAVRLPEGTTVWAASFRMDDHLRDQPPDFGLYLDERWQPPWPHAHIDWPDFGLPADRMAMRDALADALQRARLGEIVEIGCLGGHGRTGTALACLAVLAGLDSDPVAWVRSTYCEHAVETDEQADLVRALLP